MSDPITAFRDEWFSLSNFWVEADGLTVEHRFQAAKTFDPASRARILLAPTPAKAKYFGRSCALRSDWESVKEAVMLELIRQKFTAAPPRQVLLATGDRRLVEGNTWGDRYWGVDAATGQGQNRLGDLLAQVRAEVQAEDAQRG